MRRSLITTVAAAVTMALLAMLVPMALLLRGYALEDRISRAALEVQATETVVSGAGDDRGAVAVYLERINRGNGTDTTVLYPGEDLTTDLGPDPGEDFRVVDARNTGRARLDDADDGAEFLVPVSLGGSSARPEDTPVIRVVVHEPGWTESGILRSWLVLLLLGLALLAGALVLADRLGRSFVQPIRALASYAGALGQRAGPPEPLEPSGPPEVRELSAALNRLVERIQVLLERERAGVADASHRLRHADHRPCGYASRGCPTGATVTACPGTWTSSRRWSTTWCARRDDPSGRAWSPPSTVWRSWPSGCGSGSHWPRSSSGRSC